MHPAQIYQLFGQILERVAGGALAAAGYALQPNPIHHARGLFRYQKNLAEGVTASVEFQALAYQSGPSRFRINLVRAGEGAHTRTEIPLSRLLWDGFGVEQPGGPDHWWAFASPAQMGQAIAGAGKLLFAFGIPWLEGALHANDM